jgi:histone H3/H4
MVIQSTEIISRLQMKCRHLKMNSSAITLFEQSLARFVKKFLEISTDYSQYFHRSTIQAEDVHHTVRILSQRYYSIITTSRSDDEDYREEDEDDEEQKLRKEREEGEDDQNMVEFETISSSAEEELDDEDSLTDDLKIDLNEIDKEIDFSNSETDSDENLISLKSFYHLLRACWNRNLSPSMSFSAFDAFRSFVEHHVILNLEGSPRSVPHDFYHSHTLTVSLRSLISGPSSHLALFADYSTKKN